MKKSNPIFRGKGSAAMWGFLNSAKTIDDLQDALYTICYRLQELERRLENGHYDGRRKKGKP